MEKEAGIKGTKTCDHGKFDNIAWRYQLNSHLANQEHMYVKRT